MFRWLEAVKSPSIFVKRTGDAVWTIQGYGLVLFTFASFFPRLSHVQEYAFLCLLLLAVIYAGHEGKPFWIRSPIDLPLMLFIGWVLLTTPFATDPAYSFAEWRKLVAHVLVLYSAALVFRMHANEVLTRRVMGALMIGTIVLCGYAIADFVARGGSWEDRSVRAGAPSSDYNWLTTYLVITIPILITVGFTYRARWKRVAFACAGVLGMLAQTISYTRAGWLGLMAEAIAFGLFTGRRRLIMWMFGAAVVIVIGLITVSQFGYQRQTVSTDNVQFRLIIWENAIHDIALHPFVGVGYGNDTFPKRYGVHPNTGVPAGMHSLFLMVAFGSGLPALGLLMWTLMRLVRVLVCAQSSQSGQGNRLTMLGVAARVVGVFGAKSFGLHVCW